MSAELDKEAIPYKRHRGGEGGLDGLVGQSIQLGSPDKKKRKSSALGPSLPPLSEYAPPTNPSSDHLVASNPFDDDYNIISYGSPPVGNPYFSTPGYSGIGGYNTFRIPPNMSPRMSSQYCSPYAFRGQPPPFLQNTMGMAFGRPPSFNVAAQDNSNYANQSFYNSGIGQTITMPGQHFRSNPSEIFCPVTTQNSTQMNNLEAACNMGPSSNMNFNHITNQQLEMHHPFIQPQNNFNLTKLSTPKQDFQPVSSKNSNQNSATHQRHQNSDDTMCPAPTVDLKSSKSLLVGAENSHSNSANVINGSHTNGTRGKFHPPRLAAVVTSPERSNKPSLHSSHLGHSSLDPVYPCGICTNEVNDYQDAIMCEASCQLWFHRICTGMTETAYRFLTAEASAVWGCDTCMSKKDVQLMLTRQSALSHPDG